MNIFILIIPKEYTKEHRIVKIKETKLNTLNDIALHINRTKEIYPHSSHYRQR